MKSKLKFFLFINILATIFFQKITFANEIATICEVVGADALLQMKLYLKLILSIHQAKILLWHLVM